MRTFLAMVAAILCLTASICMAATGGKGTRQEAKALVERAAAYIKEHGKEKAFVEFSNPKGKFVKNDLYIFAIGFNGVFLAHGSDPSLIGKNQLQSKDENIRLVTIGLIDTARKGEGWYDYKWPHPKTKMMQKKSSYVKRVDDTVFIGCGVYH